MENQTTFITKEDDEKNGYVGGVDARRLESLIEKVERLQEQKKDLQDDIASVFAEAKAVGYDVKIMREVIKLRKMNAVDRDEKDFVIETYRKALGV